MWSRLHVTVFVGLAVIVWALLLSLRHTPISWDHLWPFSFVVGFLVLVGIAFENFLWRLRLLHGWFVKLPDLRGTWKGTLQSDWTDNVTQQRVPPTACFVGVVQTFSTLNIHLMTVESESWLISKDIRESRKSDGYQVVGVYTNQPHSFLRGAHSEIHLGALILETHGISQARPSTLTGEYWTDRKTKGTVVLEKVTKVVWTRFEDAAKMFKA